jgi:hypothetical protein
LIDINNTADLPKPLFFTKLIDTLNRQSINFGPAAAVTRLHANADGEIVESSTQDAHKKLCDKATALVNFVL